MEGYLEFRLISSPAKFRVSNRTLCERLYLDGMFDDMRSRAFDSAARSLLLVPLS